MGALLDLFNPELIIRYGGMTLLLFIIFAETGLFFGFFLPGDSLLFVAGLLCDTKYLDQPIATLILLLIVVAVAGTVVGYLCGSWAGTRLKNMRDNFFYKKKYLTLADDFYTKHGLMAFVLGRFLPIVRTFVPIMAGIIRVPFGKFMAFNILGATFWIASMVLAGHWLGRAFPELIHNLEIVVIAIVAITALPVAVSYFRKSGPVLKHAGKSNHQ